jgi:hypothetical protein
MSYAQLVLFYLMATIMWLLFTELWSKRAATILWWTLVTSSLRSTITRTYNLWYKRLMKTAVYTSKDRHKALVYYAAKDFVNLSFEQKWDAGYALGLCDHYDAMRDEELLEDYIFEKVMRDNILDEFMSTIRRIKLNGE